MISSAFDELDAGEVFPMAHSLLEKGFVSAREIGVDLVRDDSEVPDAFFARRSGPSIADQRLFGSCLSDPSFALIPFDLGCRLGFRSLSRSVIAGTMRLAALAVVFRLRHGRVQLEQLVFQIALLTTSTDKKKEIMKEMEVEQWH